MAILEMQQQVGIKDFFDDLLLRFNPARVIELGTGIGGLAVMLSLYCKILNISFHTFDISNERIRTEYIDVIKLLGGLMYTHDILTDYNIIKDLIISDGKTLVLCDNGDKKRELKIYSSYLKFGDIIMAHDYYRSMKAFIGSGISGSCEIDKNYVKNIAADNDLKWDIITQNQERMLWAVLIKS